MVILTLKIANIMKKRLILLLLTVFLALSGCMHLHSSLSKKKLRQKFPSATQKQIKDMKNGIVEPGMTPGMVIATWGIPQNMGGYRSTDTPWTYNKSTAYAVDIRTVYWQNGVVSDVDL